ncbi:MAG: hypothetical protein ABSB67_20430 [Bryobacteraceae bacterium]|jgi:hypothetical protein
MGNRLTPTQVITVNPNDFYFTGTLNGVPVQNIGGSGFQGLTSLAQVQAAVILHELGHATGALPSDANSDTASMGNTATVVKDCF